MDKSRPTLRVRALRYAKATLASFVPRNWAAHALVSLIPYGILGNLRTAIYRWFGFRGIAPGVWFHGTPTFRGCGKIGERLYIGRCTSINTPSLFDLAATITIGQRVGIGPNITLTTGSHAIGPPEERRGTLYSRDITIGNGVWIGSNVTILPGVIIGEGAVVAAGSLVNHDVLPNTVVGGVPAIHIRDLGDRDAPAMVMLRRCSGGVRYVFNQKCR